MNVKRFTARTSRDALMLVRQSNRQRRGQALQGDGSLRGKLELPFPLTGAHSGVTCVKCHEKIGPTSIEADQGSIRR